MGKFLEKYKCPKLTQEETKTLNSSINFKGIESAVNKIKQNNLTSSVIFYQTCKEQVILILPNYYREEKKRDTQLIYLG